MLEISNGQNGEVVLTGRFDAAQVDKAKGFFATINQGTTLDFSRLDYISSAGLGILLATQKRLRDGGHGLRLINLNSHIRDVLRLSGFDQIFEMG